MKTKLIIYALAAALTVVNGTRAQSPAGCAVPVNPDDFIRAESDLYFGKLVKDGSFGKFTHNRELTSIDKQLVVRSNRDTLNSGAVFDLDAGPVTITLPNAGKHFMSMQVIDEDMRWVPRCAAASLLDGDCPLSPLLEMRHICSRCQRLMQIVHQRNPYSALLGRGPASYRG